MCIFPQKVKYIFGTKHLRKVKTLEKKTPCFEQGSLSSLLCVLVIYVYNLGSLCQTYFTYTFMVSEEKSY